MKKAIKILLKEVGINGLIAIKAHFLKGSGHSMTFYTWLQKHNTVNDILHIRKLFLTHREPFKQYQ